jgi:hypothetical protein
MLREKIALSILVIATALLTSVCVYWLVVAGLKTGWIIAAGCVGVVGVTWREAWNARARGARRLMGVFVATALSMAAMFAMLAEQLNRLAERPEVCLEAAPKWSSDTRAPPPAPPR